MTERSILVYYFQGKSSRLLYEWSTYVSSSFIRKTGKWLEYDKHSRLLLCPVDIPWDTTEYKHSYLYKLHKGFKLL